MPVGLLLASLLVTVTNEVAPSDRLAPCPESPNCVSTLATDPDKAMPPLLYDLPEEDVMEAIAEVVASSPRTRIVERGPRYLHAEYESLVFRFVDDVEIAIDPERHRVDFRSASRKGYSDLGVNRRRMERLSRRLAERPGISIAGAP